MTSPFLLPDGNVQIAFSGGRTSAFMLHKILEANGAVMEGFQFVGIEMDAQYLEIARARIKAVQGERQELQQLNLFEERDNA